MPEACVLATGQPGNRMNNSCDETRCMLIGKLYPFKFRPPDTFCFNTFIHSVVEVCMATWFPNHSFTLLGDALKSIGLRFFPINNNLIGNGDSHGQMYLPRGLKNIGNTCFMNSILQAMSSSPSFLSHLVSLKQYSSPDSFSVILLNGLRELRDRTVSSPYSAANPERIKRKLEEFKGIFKGSDENDAQELFQAVLEMVDKERNKVVRKNFQDSLSSVARGHSRFSFKHSGVSSPLLLDRSRGRPVNPCEGLLAMHMKCITCQQATGHSGWKAVKMEPFTALPLTIPSPGSKLSQFSDSLDGTSPTRVSGLFGGGMNAKQFKIPSLPKRTLSDVNLESCIDLFLESEERTDINCESCTLYNVAQSYNSRTSKSSTKSTAEESDEHVKKPLDASVGDFKLRCMSSRDSFQLDVESEEVAEEVRECNSVLYRMIWGKDRLKYLVQQSMIHSTTISMFPPLLCFHIKRIFFTSSGHLKKDNTKVKFPVILDVNKYVRTPEGNGKSGKNSRSNSVCSTVSGDSDATSVCSRSDAGSLVGQESKASRIADYLLRAVVVHCGSPTSGHYIAYCLVEDTPRRKWAYFSDQQVDYVDESRVLASEAYMLFYDRATTASTAGDAL